MEEKFFAGPLKSRNLVYAIQHATVNQSTSRVIERLSCKILHLDVQESVNLVILDRIFDKVGNILLLIFYL